MQNKGIAILLYSKMQKLTTQVSFHVCLTILSIDGTIVEGTIIKCIQSFDLIRLIQPSFTPPMKYPLFHCSDILQLQQHVQCIINIVSLWNYLLIPGVMPFLCTVRQLKTPSVHSKTSCIQTNRNAEILPYLLMRFHIISFSSAAE